MRLTTVAGEGEHDHVIWFGRPESFEALRDRCPGRLAINQKLRSCSKVVGKQRMESHRVALGSSQFRD
jgi:hypothetical protein